MFFFLCMDYVGGVNMSLRTTNRVSASHGERVGRGAVGDGWLRVGGNGELGLGLVSRASPLFLFISILFNSFSKRVLSKNR